MGLRLSPPALATVPDAQSCYTPWTSKRVPVALFEIAFDKQTNVAGVRVANSKDVYFDVCRRQS